MTPPVPAPRQIGSYKTAVENAIDWMRHWGHADAGVPLGEEDRVDVCAGDALAGVRFEAKHVDTTTLLEFLGTLPQDTPKRLFFFSAVGFDQRALAYANDVGIALFTYNIEGLMTPINDEARRVGHHHSSNAPCPEEQAQLGDKRGPDDHPEHTQSEETLQSQELESSPTAAEESSLEAMSCLGVTIGIAALGMSLFSLVLMGLNVWGLFTEAHVEWWDPLANLMLAIAFLGSVAAVPTGSNDGSRHALAFPFLLFSLMTIVWGMADRQVAATITGTAAVCSLIAWATVARGPKASPEHQVAPEAAEAPSMHQSSPSIMPLSEVPTFSQVRVLDYGSIDQFDEPPEVLEDVVPVWTNNEKLETESALFIPARGVLDSTHGLVWLPQDATVRLIDWAQFAGDPANLVNRAIPSARRSGGIDDLRPPQKWPSVIADSEILTSAVQDDATFSVFEGDPDAEASVEVILCALNVTPNWDPTVREALIGALEVQYARVIDDPFEYPPDQYPWRQVADPGPDVSPSPSHGHRHDDIVPASKEM